MCGFSAERIGGSVGLARSPSMVRLTSHRSISQGNRMLNFVSEALALEVFAIVVSSEMSSH